MVLLVPFEVSRKGSGLVCVFGVSILNQFLRFFDCIWNWFDSVVFFFKFCQYNLLLLNSISLSGFVCVSFLLYHNFIFVNTFYLVTQETSLPSLSAKVRISYQVGNSNLSQIDRNSIQYVYCNNYYFIIVLYVIVHTNSSSKDYLY